MLTPKIESKYNAIQMFGCEIMKNKRMKENVSLHLEKIFIVFFVGFHRTITFNKYRKTIAHYA